MTVQPGLPPQPDRDDSEAFPGTAGSGEIAQDGTDAVLLLSGGLDSTALAALTRPAVCLAVDYGQRSAVGEFRAAAAVCRALRLTLSTLTLDLGGLGGGLLKDEDVLPGAPSPEWWPYRNQILVTAAASVALQAGLPQVLTGTVAGDGSRHIDGRPAFYQALDCLISMQEGGIRVRAPAINETSAELVRRSGLTEDVLGWTVSCHRASFPCGDCPGCWKRTKVLSDLGILSCTRP
jgi:7-cyano-7-deazaguanine synthase